MIAYALLFFIPLSLALRYLPEVPPIWIFTASDAARRNLGTIPALAVPFPPLR